MKRFHCRLLKSLRSLVLFTERMPAINHDTQDTLTQATLILVKRRSELKVTLSRAHGHELKRKGTAYKRNNKLIGCKPHNYYLYAIIPHTYYSPIDIQYLMAKNSFLGDTVKNAKGYWKFFFPFFLLTVTISQIGS